MQNIAFQYELRPALPNVYGTFDYREFRETLLKMDEILSKSELEHDMVLHALAEFEKDHHIEPEKFYSSRKFNYHYKIFRYALRCNIARHLIGESYRQFSIHLADSLLLQWFTGISAFGKRKAVSKSSLDRYEKYFDEEFIRKIIRQWLSTLSDTDKALDSGLHEPIDYDTVLLDTTCIKAHIHFPVDWILLRDAARSLLLAIMTIRKQGLKNRMIEPKLLLKQMNKLCIEMTHTRRKTDSKKQRKSILREMKKLSQRISKHAYRYRALLQDEWEKTGWSERQAKQVIRRIDVILKQLPAAIKQAHDRIIGGRQSESSEKILSLYDKDAQVIVRGKSGNEVEFGQRFLLSEQRNGIIIDWELLSEKKSPTDSELFEPTINRIEKEYGAINSATADRAFSSKRSNEFLEEKNIYNGICPKSPKQLQERLKESKFIELQTRRSQTEGRIGIFKNVFVGKPLRTRITLNKRHAINWCVLTHNLWVLARKTISEEKMELKKAA